MMFDVVQLAKKHKRKPDAIRRWIKVLGIPDPDHRQPKDWQILRQVIEGKYPVTKIEVGAKVILPNGIHRVEKITHENGTTYLWALGDKFPIHECYYLDPTDRLSDWFGKCPSCNLGASDYVPRQRVGNTWVGGFAFCDPCLRALKPKFLDNGKL